MISLPILSVLVYAVSADPFTFGKIPPYGIPPPLIEAENEGIEKGLDIAKEFSFEKAWPWLEKEFAFEKGVGEGLEIGKGVEIEKALGMGFGKEIGYEKSMWFPWALWEKYFGVEKKLTFQQALAIELFRKYGYYGLWVAKELERRFKIAKELGLIGEEIAFQEAITLGLFKGIGLDKIFESALKAIGVEKAAATTAAATKDIEKIFGLWKKF